MAPRQNLKIDGIVPIIPTPFYQDETIALPGLHSLIGFAAAGGCCAVCLPAYASEFYKLSERERTDVVHEAVVASAGRIPVIGQANHPAARHAAAFARELQEAGADAIAVAVPRLFGLPEKDLLHYFDVVLSAIDVPLLIQDFNPGGPTVSAKFVADLHRQHPHFRYIKLEEPLMGGKVKAILDATGGDVGVLEGWGGMYLLELLDAGICGVMPGLAVSDLLARAYTLARSGDKQAAYCVFEGVLPQIVFSLQSMEFFHLAEKGLLCARGILRETAVRDATITPDATEAAHVAFLNAQILALLARLGMPANPAAAKN